RLSDDVENAPQRRVSDRDRDRPAGIRDLLAAHQPPGRVHGAAADGVLAQMLRHLHHQPVAVVVGLERVQDRRQVVDEVHVDAGADHLGYLARYGHRWSPCSGQSASAPEMISISSLVIAAWRDRLYSIVSLSIISPAL